MGRSAADHPYAENRLVTVTIKATGHRSEFGYDGLGRRVEIIEKDKDAGGNLTTTTDKKYLWDGVEIAEERSPDGFTVIKRFYGDGFVDSDGTVLYYTRGHLGSVQELTDSTQTVRARYEYDPYGRMTKISGDRDSFLGYTGHPWHHQSGLNLTLFRAYDPNLGRWLSADPLNLIGGLTPLHIYYRTFTSEKTSTISESEVMNTRYSAGNIGNTIFFVNHSNNYIYAQNNPINNLDLLGLKDCPYSRCDPKKHCKDKTPYTAKKCQSCCDMALTLCLDGSCAEWWEKVWPFNLSIHGKCIGLKSECDAKCSVKETDPGGSEGAD